MRRLLIGMALPLLLTGCGRDEEPIEPVADIEAGRQFVSVHCTGCHTLDGGGKTAEIPNLAGQPARYLSEAMHAYRDGRRRHVALQDLIQECTEADIANISAFFASLPPLEVEPSLAGEDTTYREGEAVAAVCAGCHGDNGFSTTPGVPNLAGQHPMYLILATQDYARGARDNSEKEAMLQGLANVDIEKMAMYFAAQAPEPRDPPPFGDPVAGEAQTAVCGSCHGANGVSDNPMMPNLAGQEPAYLVRAIRAYRDRERSHQDMVAAKSDSEIEDIAAYYSVQAVGLASADANQVADIVAKCDRCHGNAVGESAMAVPVLHGQKRDYLLRVMRQYRDERRGNSMMHKMSAGYSDAVLAEIAEYYATHQSPR